MIAPNYNSLCRQAELYYYDFLCGESCELVPEFIISHIEQCQNCLERINQLKGALSQTDGLESGESQVSSAVTAMLKLHFAYIGKRITCEAVKPFLPGLLDPALEIRIPTPITTHLDNCRQCSEDLETIRRLNLNRKQLRRLSQLLADKPDEDTVSCSTARLAVPSVVSMVFRKTSAEVLKHLCTCPDCRELIYQRRETVRSGLLCSRMAQGQFSCGAISATDIFDYVVPYGIDPDADQYAKFRQSFTSHISTCPTCLDKMQNLHNTVYNIVERDESGVVTIYHIDESAKAQALIESDDLYADWPIRVQVLDKSGPEPDIITFPQRVKKRLSAVNLARLRIPAVAAIILIAVGLFFFGTPVAKAVDLGQIYKALEQIKNVCITTFYQQEPEPTQERWMSQTLNTMILKTKTQWVLWDIKDKSRKTRDLSTGSIETAELSEDAFAGVEETMRAPWGLLPFKAFNEAPEGAKERWMAETRVYELTWHEKALDGSIVYNKWRFYIDIRTKLPNRVERWEKPVKEEYKLLTVIKVAYPTAVEIRSVIEDAGF